MLSFSVRPSARLLNHGFGSGPGRIWIAGPGDIKWVRDHAINLNAAHKRAVWWRVSWLKPWAAIDCYWIPGDRTLLIDDIMKLEAGHPVMFLFTAARAHPKNVGRSDAQCVSVQV